MRVVTHTDHGLRVLPPPMPDRTGAPLSRHDMSQIVEAISRLQGEALRRELPEDILGRIDAVRGIALGMYTLTPASPLSFPKEAS